MVGSMAVLLSMGCRFIGITSSAYYAAGLWVRTPGRGVPGMGGGRWGEAGARWAFQSYPTQVNQTEYLITN